MALGTWPQPQCEVNKRNVENNYSSAVCSFAYYQWDNTPMYTLWVA